MPKRAGLEKTKSKFKSMTLASARWRLFDQPQLLEGEDAATYQELLASIRTAVEPADIVDDMLIDDVAALEWEVLRWRRLKTTLIRARGHTALQHFLNGKLDYDLYSDRFADRLTEILQENLPEDQPEDFAKTLAQKYARNEPDAVDKVNEILDRSDQDLLDNILNRAQYDKAEALVQQYARHEADAVRLVSDLLAQAGTSIDALLVDSLERDFDYIERIDRLTAVAEARRNASLREIDRRRAHLGEALRRTLPEVEGEFEVIEAKPAKGEKAA
jgi:hypothetical protein